jgi:hypothetical protein
MDSGNYYLMHWIRQEVGERSSLAHRFLFVTFKQLIEIGFLFVLGENLQAVMVVSYVLLVNPKHRQQHIEQIYNSAIRITVLYARNRDDKLNSERVQCE